MTQAQHTPAPWQVMPAEDDKDYIRIRGKQLGKRYKIANVLIPVYTDSSIFEMDESISNARLIAAAPELLEALETFLKAKSVKEDINIDFLQAKELSNQLVAEAWILADKAIAKAKGGVV